MRTDKIGINISRLRIEHGITQEQLGRDIGFLSCLGLRSIPYYLINLTQI